MKKEINNKPDSIYMWKGLGGHFDSISQIINEFLDNSISNFKSSNPILKNIVLKIEEKEEEIIISIEDSGGGIEDIDHAFSLGSQKVKNSPLNEHGFGLKHALASANPENSNWIVTTRTQSDFEKSKYQKIISSYRFENFFSEEKLVNEEEWPGIINGSGTYISFSCSKQLFNTVSEGLKGNYSKFETKVDLLIEDIGFIYSRLIEEDIANVSVMFIDVEGNKKNKNVAALKPNIEKTISPGTGNELVKIDGNMVSLDYEFIAIKDSNNRKYYKKNMSNSGVEISINGRVIAYNLFQEIWNIEKHNSYNYLLVRLNIKSDDPKTLPTTRTSKNGIRKGDKKIEDLYLWIRNHISNPSKKIEDATHEIELFKELSEIKEKQLKQLSGAHVVSLEKNVFLNIKDSIRIDLYQVFQNKVTLYEGKRESTSVKDIYQLKMYWDGCIVDGIKPNQGILLATNHPNSVIKMLDYVNKMKDSNGDDYNFLLKTWKEEGINYPN